MSTTKRTPAKATKKKKRPQIAADVFKDFCIGRPGSVVVRGALLDLELKRLPSGALWMNRVDDPEGLEVNEARLAKVLAAFYLREF